MSSTDDNGWFVYMIHCDDDSLYTGITTDMVRRWSEHGGLSCEYGGESKRFDRTRSGLCKDKASEAKNLSAATVKLNRGAKFFRGRKPLQLAYIESGHNRSSASRREATIKRLSRTAKLQLLTADHNELHTLDRALLPMLDSGSQT